MRFACSIGTSRFYFQEHLNVLFMETENPDSHGSSVSGVPVWMEMLIGLYISI